MPPAKTHKQVFDRLVVLHTPAQRPRRGLPHLAFLLSLHLLLLDRPHHVLALRLQQGFGLLFDDIQVSVGDVLHLDLVGPGLLGILGLFEVGRLGVADELVVLADQFEVDDAQTFAGPADHVLPDSDDRKLVFA